MNTYNIRLAYLYPKLLNIYGDYGNVLTIRKRCEWRGIELSVQEINIGDKISPRNFDMYFIGGGQDQQQIIVSQELQKHKNALQDAQDKNAVFLGICGGYQLFGEYYKPQKSDKLLGIELLDVYTKAGKTRHIGNVTATCDFLNPSSIVGFENHSGLTYIRKNSETVPLATIKIGAGNNGKDGFEGARKKNVFGTYLHGSILPKNPHFTDYLIKLAIQKRYKINIELEELDDTYGILAHNNILLKKY